MQIVTLVSMQPIHDDKKKSNHRQLVRMSPNRAILREKEYHSSVNFDGDPKSRLEIKKFLVDMPFSREWVGGGRGV